jgi:hypothetical protein
MSPGWTLLGTLGQLMLAYLLFMLAVFTGGGLASGHRFSVFQVKILDLSMFVLPGTCGLSALIVCFLHWQGCSAWSYGWYALPLAAAAAYRCFVNAMVRKVRHRR